VFSRTHAQPEEEDPMEEREQKLKEDVAQKERHEHFNTIWPTFPTNQEWRVKEKANIPAPMTSDNDMDVLDDDESPLIKNGSPPPIGMDINMVFTLPAEFRGAKEKVAQMCLGPMEALFEKPKESSQHMKALYVGGHINGRPISQMLINGGAVINLMSYSIFKKIEREDDELMKTNLMLNGMGGTRWRLGESSLWSSPLGASIFLPLSSSLKCKVTIVLFLATIGFTPIIEFPLYCTNS
jgi:hypothetical protein